MQLVDSPAKQATVDQLKAMSGNRGTGEGEGHGKSYQFPTREPSEAGHYATTATANCAIFPSMVGVPVPEPSGMLGTYMPALEKWAAEGPIDLRGAGTRVPRGGA